MFLRVAASAADPLESHPLTQRALAAVEQFVPVPVARRNLLWSLGLGAFGLAFSITVVAAYLPPLLSKFTDRRC